MKKSDFEAHMIESIQQQRAKLLSFARRIYPHLTYDDIQQPNDFPELEQNPCFRFEEGILQGLLTFQTLYQREGVSPLFPSKETMENLS